VLGTLFWHTSTKNKLENMTQQAAAATANKGKIDAIDTRIGEAQAAIAPMDNKRDYMMALRDYGDVWPERMQALNRYIYRRVELISAQLTPDGVSLQARTKTSEDLARMLLDLKQTYPAGLLRPDSLTVNGVTGWPNSLGFSYTAGARTHIALPGGFGGLSPVGHATGGGGGATDQASQGTTAPGAAADQGSGPGSATPLVQPSGGGEPAQGAAGAAAGGGSAVVARLPQYRAPVLLSAADAARARYLQRSVEPNLQPYMVLSISAEWAAKIAEPGAPPPGAAPVDPAGDPAAMAPPPESAP
jgi:hypothetical protein